MRLFFIGVGTKRGVPPTVSCPSGPVMKSHMQL